MEVPQADVESSSSEEEFDAADDEEIDEEAAFTLADWQRYSEWFQKDLESDDGSGSGEEGPEAESQSEKEDVEEGGHEHHADVWLEGSDGATLFLYLFSVVSCSGSVEGSTGWVRCSGAQAVVNVCAYNSCMCWGWRARNSCTRCVLNTCVLQRCCCAKCCGGLVQWVRCRFAVACTQQRLPRRMRPAFNCECIHVVYACCGCCTAGGEEDGERGSEGSEEGSGGSDQNDPEASADEDSQHEQLLARIAADGSKRRRRTVVLREAIAEGEHSVAAAGHDMHAEGTEGELGLQELLHATQVSQADRKALQKLAAGKKVRRRALLRVCLPVPFVPSTLPRS